MNCQDTARFDSMEIRKVCHYNLDSTMFREGGEEDFCREFHTGFRIPTDLRHRRGKQIQYRRSSVRLAEVRSDLLALVCCAGTLVGRA